MLQDYNNAPSNRRKYGCTSVYQIDNTYMISAHRMQITTYFALKMQKKKLPKAIVNPDYSLHSFVINIIFACVLIEYKKHRNSRLFSKNRRWCLHTNIFTFPHIFPPPIPAIARAITVFFPSSSLRVIITSYLLPAKHLFWFYNTAARSIIMQITEPLWDCSRKAKRWSWVLVALFFKRGHCRNIICRGTNWNRHVTPLRKRRFNLNKKLGPLSPK